MIQPTAIAPDSDAYYVKLFVDSPAWSSPTPNEDEAARWKKISAFVHTIAAKSPNKRLRILDVGCGRGWLTNLLCEFGNCDGVEPVAPVVEQAKKLFPTLRFTAGTAETIFESPDFQPYDLIVSSEVIEHVPRGEQPDFARKLASLLKPGGHVILTTPRGESLREWTRQFGDPSQPVEDWLREPELRELFTRARFTVIGHERVVFDAESRRFIAGDAPKTSDDTIAIYQVWAFQLPPVSPLAALAATPQIFVSESTLSRFHRTGLAAAESALVDLPDHPDLMTARASSLLGLGELDAARKSLAWTVALHADYVPARRLFAETLGRIGETVAAETQANRAAELEQAAQEKTGGRVFSFLEHLREGLLIEGSAAQLEVRNVAISGRNARCIYLHPPAKLRFEVPSPGAGHFSCALAIQPEAWDKPTAGGCEFFLRIDGREAFRKAINPRQFPAHRCWHEIEVDVPAVPGRVHEFIFRTQAVGSPPDFRWALWREPMFRPIAAPVP